MANLHESEISKTRKIAGYILTILPSLMIVFSGVSKVMGSEQMVLNMSRIPNFGEMITTLGVLEIIIVILYWIPKTSNIGFFLFCSFTGGIIVGELVAGDMPIPGIMVSIFLYVGTMLRKPSLSGLGI